jgi:hypothetical protein
VPAEGPPKISIDGAEVADFPAKAARVLFIRPLFPNIHPAPAQVRFVRITRQKPKQFFGNPAKGHSFGRDNGKAFAQIEARLKSEVRDCTNACAILMFDAAFED